MRDAIQKRLLKHAEALQNVQDATALYWITWIFALGNIVLAYGVWVLHNTPGILTTKAHLTLRFWAVIFFILGVSMVFSILTRRYRLLRASIIGGLFVKTTWMIALVGSILSGGSSIFFTIWLMITLIQLVVLLYIPKEKQDNVINTSD